MEEFEISATELDITTNYNNANADFFIYDNSGVCNYQSPTYNTYQNPNYNIFVNPIINNYGGDGAPFIFNGEKACSWNDFVQEEIFIQKVPTHIQINSTSDAEQQNDKYVVVKTDHIKKTLSAKRMTKKDVIEMLERKAEEALYHKYKIKVIL